MTGESGGELSLEYTPTWAVATVCFIMIAISVLIEHSLHLLAKYLKRRRRKYLLQALNKMKSDLMLLGFISLLLTALERPISNICISEDAAGSFLPCESLTSDDEEEHRCREQMKKWEHWEAETRTLEYQFSNDPRRFQFIHQTSFGRRHLQSWSEKRLLRIPVNFLRQFFGSVYKVDYLTLRHGFIAAHFVEGSNFDFQNYLQRALEKDFEVMVGMRLWNWIFSVIFIFFNAYVLHSYFWLPFIPFLMLLVVGTKLQGIITKMCLDSSDKSHVVRGPLLVKPSDHFFWFDGPRLLLQLMHFISFQNSFLAAFFVWSSYKFGLRSCFHRQTGDIVIKIAMSVLIPILCGYVTLPLYALVAQMGSSLGKSVFPERVRSGLKRWRAKARRNLARKKTIDASVKISPSVATLDSSVSVDLGYMTDGVDSVERLDVRVDEWQPQKSHKT